MSSPQKENGFTPIANELLEAFYRCKLLEYERVIMLCIWRKTYGWNKKEDWVSNSQLHEETGIALPNITRTIKSLREKFVISKKGKLVCVNKCYKEWNVEWRKVISPDNLVISPDNKKLSHQIPTKEKKETITKDTSRRGVDKNKSKPIRGATIDDMTTFNQLGAEVIHDFVSIDPKNKTYYNNKTQRAACDFLIEEYGLEEVKNRIMIASKTNGLPFFPTITTPCQLRDKWVQLEKAIERHKREASNNLVAF